jgi:alpha-L-rhamnosidase
MIQPINVTINYSRLSDEMYTHLVDGSPVMFSWGALSDDDKDVQTSRRLTLTAEDYFWDSGWTEGAEPSLRYEGTLPEAQRVDFCLLLRDSSGRESVPYRSYLVNAGVSWRAGWIGLDDALDESCIYLRRSFTVEKPLKRACLYACGIGYQQLFLDGLALDDAHLNPVFTDYRAECDYVFLPELQQMLAPGEHVLGVVLAGGWRYNPGVSRFLNKLADFSGPKQLTAMLRMTFMDGEERWILTDENWQAGRGTQTFASVFDGSSWDARKCRQGWDLPGFSGEGFSAARPLPAPGGAMRPMLIPPVKEHALRTPIAAWPVDGGVVMDFGQNLAGVLRVPLPAGLKSGQRVELIHAEELTGDGLPFRDTLRGARAEDVYTASGDGRDLAVWQPEFTYHGFRYAMIRGLGEGYDAQGVRAVELHTALRETGSFRCGSALVTRIHDLCVETERGNMHGILTDCPQRDERMQWMNDATVRFEATPFNFDIGRMFPKIVRDVMQMQRADGAIGCTAPFVYGAVPADPVCSSFLLAGYEAMMHTGNLDILKEAYPAFCSWENYLLSRSEGYIVDYSYYGDWAGPAYACVPSKGDGDPGAYSAVTPGVFMSTGYSYLNCVLLSTIAQWLGSPEEARAHNETAERIRDAMLSKWYDPQRAAMATGSQGCQAFSLWLGIIPDPDRQRAAKLMRDNLADSGYRITTGNLCTRYLMDMLTEYGYIEDAWKVITREEYPSLGYMLQQEATTVWERFELMKDPTMNSHNHPMYASMDSWMYRYLAGIRPLEPGWARVRVRPYFPAKLLSAQAAVDTPRGLLSVRWFKRYGRTVLQVNVPFGVEAEITLNEETRCVRSGFHVMEAPCPEELTEA